MTLEAPEAHTTHELLELVAAVLGETAERAAAEVPGVILDACVEDGPFDFGALYLPGATGALEFVRGRGFPSELKPTLQTAFGAIAHLEACRRSGEAEVLDSTDTEDDSGGGLEEAMGATCAVLVPLVDEPEDCPVLLLAAILHDVSGTGEALARSLQSVVRFARKREQQLAESLNATRRWDRLVQAVSEALLFADPDGAITQVNAAAADLFGIASGQLVGTTVQDILPGLSYRSEEWSGLAVLPGGKEKVQVRTAILPDDEQGRALYLHSVHLIGIPQAATMADSGQLDSSTGLPDRSAFAAELEREMVLARKYRGWCSVLIIDLDGLSALRQTVGDEAVSLLRGIGQALTARLRRSDRLGRLGGDGFGVLLSRGSREQALSLATSLLGLIRERSEAMGHPLTASIGISYYPDDGDDANILLDTAFGAMMLAKRSGGDHALVWSPGLMGGRRDSAPLPRTKPTTQRVSDSSITQPKTEPAPPVRRNTARSPTRVPALEPIEVDALPDDEDTDIIDEVLDMNNLVIAMPEDPSAEVE